MNYQDAVFKLQVGINNLEECPFKVTVNKNQFYSAEKHKPITIYSVKLVIPNEAKGKPDYVEAFKTGVQLFLVFFMRNLWFTLIGREIPETQFPEFEHLWETFLDEHKEELP